MGNVIRGLLVVFVVAIILIATVLVFDGIKTDRAMRAKCMAHGYPELDFVTEIGKARVWYCKKKVFGSDVLVP